jgi:ABC-type nitrate/sulfonate/bicarbonate transport system ATPase subunit
MVNTAPSVCLDNLSKRYRSNGSTVIAVERATLKLAPGSFTALVGPSGCGKTTLLRLIAGLERSDDGRVEVHPGESIPAVVFQDPRLLPWMTVRRNLLLSLRRCPGAPFSREETEERIGEALDLVGLTDRAEAYPHELSGGMAQRGVLARALCRRSGFLLMDEPFSALDALTRSRLQQDLKRIWEQRKGTVLFITHDIAEAVFLADRVLVMISGRIAGDIPVDSSNPAEAETAILSLMGASA